jgi:phosphate transport system permease protein
MAATTARPSRTVLPGSDRPVAAGPTTPRPRIRPGAVRRSDVLALVGAAMAATGITWLLFHELAPFTGLIGEVVVGWVSFVLMYALLVSFDESGQAVRDRLAMVTITGLAVLLLIGLVFVVAYVLYRGRSALSHLNTFTQDLSVTGPLDPITKGGIVHGVVGTLEQITVALLVTVPLGLTCAVFLNEFRGPFPRFVRTIVEAMTALPSIVAGLFIYTTYILTLGLDKSGFAAALALSIMMLPIIIRAADVVIRLVPGNLREASLAMGAGRWRTVWHVVLPTARSGLATAVILGTARGIGETSPVLLTAGYGQATNADPLSGPQVSLPLLAFELFKLTSETMRARSFGAAATLLLLVLGLFVSARVIGGRGPGNLSRRQQQRRAAASLADAQRFVQVRAEFPQVSAVDALVDRMSLEDTTQLSAVPVQESEGGDR